MNKDSKDQKAMTEIFEMIENLEKYRFRHRHRPIINRHNMIQLYIDKKNSIGLM